MSTWRGSQKKRARETERWTAKQAPAGPPPTSPQWVPCPRCGTRVDQLANLDGHYATAHLEAA